ncbi:Probable RNA-binding protein ARP1, partial [Linum grandiflorum]
RCLLCCCCCCYQCWLSFLYNSISHCLPPILSVSPNLNQTNSLQTMNITTTTNHYNNGSQFGDTTLTKVFVGGLAWETPKEALRDHFDKYGDILEAVIISDKLSGRSKGYGFVTFKEAEAAKKACEDATPVINGRRANCNLASLGARRPPRSSHVVPAVGSNVGGRATSANYQQQQVQWYYPAAATSPASFPHHQHPIPFYGYSPAYMPTDMTYNQKLSYGSGSYMAHVMPNQMYNQAVYPAVYHQSNAMGLPAAAHIYSPPPSGRPVIVSKPASMVAPPPSAVCLAVE